jgi:hypothetical protein
VSSASSSLDQSRQTSSGPSGSVTNATNSALHAVKLYKLKTMSKIARNIVISLLPGEDDSQESAPLSLSDLTPLPEFSTPDERYIENQIIFKVEN